MRILVVDDHVDVRLLLKHMIEKQGHAVDAASDSEEAAALAAVNRYDAAAVDLCLPSESDGMRTVGLLRAAGVPYIVLMTGSVPEVLEHIAPQLRDMGVSVLLKPFPTVPEVMRALGATAQAEVQTPQKSEG